MAKRSSGSARLRGFAKMPSQGKQPTAEVSTTRFAPSLSEPTRHRRIAVWAALAIGVILFMLSGNDMPAVRWAIVLGAAFFSIIPPLNRWLGRLFDLARCPSPRAKDWTTIGIGLAATAYLIFTAFNQDRDLFPRIGDDCSYILGARMMGHGRLWMPQHPLADFFESYYTLVKPVYASIYFPGTALMFAPVEWLHLASWILPVLICGIIVAIVYRLVDQLIDGVAAAMSTIWMVSLFWFRTVSLMVMSHVSMLLLGALILIVFLRWRRDRRLRWALAIGLCSGWAAITRPVDAIAFSLPVGIAMALELRGLPWRKWAASAAMLLLGALPFLAIQTVFDWGVTGRPFYTPYTAYLRLDQPGTEYGIRRYDPSLHPASSLREMHEMYDWCRRYLIAHQPQNFLAAWFHRQAETEQPAGFLKLIDATLPSRALVVFLPAGLLALDRRRWPIVAIVALFCLLYMANPFFLKHYPIVVAPAMIAWSLLGCQVVVDTVWPSQARRISAAVAIAILAICMTSLWEINRYMPTRGQIRRDGMMEGTTISFIDRAIDTTVTPPALIFFQPSPPGHFFEQLVYNVDAAWPDDEPIIRAHDLGERDRQMIEYYAERSPDRIFYLCDPRQSLTRLGTAAYLRDRLRAGAKVEQLLNPP